MESPYLYDAGRLADVISAIQAMGTYKFYALTFEKWAERIAGDRAAAAHWREVFEQHPEFFRLDRERTHASLTWRRQYAKLYHVDKGELLTFTQFEQLSEAEKERVSRNPLSSTDIQALMATAIDLHARALDQRRDKRWWLPLASAAGGLVGAIVGALLKGS